MTLVGIQRSEPQEAKLSPAEPQFDRIAWKRARRLRRRRAGQASLDYALIIAVILPMAAFMLWAGPRIIRVVYEMVCVMVSWPFL
jgi:hypothetical protein